MIEQHYGGKDGFWEFIKQRKDDNCLMGCSIKGEGKNGPQILDGQPSGLILNHAYGISDIIELEDLDDQSKIVRLLRLRNPWGNSEWLGDWSADSEQSVQYKKVLEEYVSDLPPDEQFDLDADDGTFLIHYRDWRDNFSSLFINNDFPEAWTGVRFQSAWTKSASGGLPLRYEATQLEKFAQNPQFLIKPVRDSEIMFSMCQPGGRLPPAKYQYSEYPYAETMNYACVSVFKLKSDQTGKNRILNSFDRQQLVYLSPIKRERENAGRCELKKDETYLIVPSTEKEGIVGQFYISIYINQPLRDVEIKRVFHPKDKNESNDEILPYFIPEEAEKISNRAPAWKIDLVKDSLKYMMTDEDTGVVCDD